MYHHHHHHHHHHQSIMVWILFGIIVTGMLHWRTIISITLYIHLVLCCLVSAPVRCYFDQFTGTNVTCRHENSDICFVRSKKKSGEVFISAFLLLSFFTHATTAGSIELDSGGGKGNTVYNIYGGERSVVRTCGKIIFFLPLFHSVTPIYRFYFHMTAYGNKK